MNGYHFYYSAVAGKAANRSGWKVPSGRVFLRNLDLLEKTIADLAGGPDFMARLIP